MKNERNPQACSSFGFCWVEGTNSRKESQWTRSSVRTWCQAPGCSHSLSPDSQTPCAGRGERKARNRTWTSPTEPDPTASLLSFPLSQPLTPGAEPDTLPSEPLHLLFPWGDAQRRLCARLGLSSSSTFSERPFQPHQPEPLTPGTPATLTWFISSELFCEE